jgi:caffeoyl-CoA O-methyltransferase
VAAADGTVINCKVDEESAALARIFFLRSSVSRMIEIRTRPALDLVSPRGLILIDNVLWNGDGLKQPAPDEKSAAAIQALNRAVSSDPPGLKLLPIADLHAVTVSVDSYNRVLFVQ